MVDWDDYFDGQAYDRGVATLRGHIAYATELAKRVELSPGMDVFEAGCGSGTIIAKLVAEEADIRIVGVDGSTVALELAKTRAREEGWSFTGRLVDLEEPLPMGKETFDRVIVAQVLYALENQGQLLAESFRILRPGGRMVLANPWRLEAARVFADHQRWLNEEASEEERQADAALSGDRDKIRAFNEGTIATAGFQFAAPDELQAMIEAPGFRMVIRDDEVFNGTSTLMVAEKPR